MVYQKFNHFKIQDTAKHISRSDPIGDQKYDNLKIRKYKIVDRGHLKIKKISRVSNFDNIFHGGVDLASRP